MVFKRDGKGLSQVSPLAQTSEGFSKLPFLPSITRKQGDSLGGWEGGRDFFLPSNQKQKKEVNLEQRFSFATPGQEKKK